MGLPPNLEITRLPQGLTSPSEGEPFPNTIVLATVQLFNKSWRGLSALKEQQFIESQFAVMRKITIWVMVVLILSSFISAELVAINANTNSSGGDQGVTLLLGLRIREHVALTDGNRHPLYPALVSLFATRDLSYFTKAKFVSLAIGLATLLVVYLLGRRLYSSGVGLVVMLLLSINNEFRWASCSVLAEVLLVLLLQNITTYQQSQPTTHFLQNISLTYQQNMRR